MSTCIEISNLKQLTLQIKRHADETLRYLSGKLRDGHYQGRSFYGETYTALAMSLIDYNHYQSQIKQIIEWYNENPKNDDNFHWEFNNYAMLKMGQVQNELNKYVLSPLTYRGIKCTNWSLLRCVGLLLEHRSIEDELIKDKILHMQMENGLILDEDHVASFQYHSFMVALLYEIYKLTNDEFYLDKFKKGIYFIEKFILQNGDTLTVGRGQEQIFGYGALLYILSIAYKELKNTKYLSLLDRVFRYVNSFWDEKRILPLVLNRYESESDKTFPITDQRHLGWYSYNNYYDYLPFFTYYLVECYSVLKNEKQDINIEPIQHQNYADDCFLRYSGLQLDIVMSCKKGASANALVFPYIQYKGKDLSSICGGDDFVSVGYNQVSSISLPYGKYKLSVRNFLRNKWFLKKTIKAFLINDESYNCTFLWSHGNFCIDFDESINTVVMYGKSEDYLYKRMCKINHNGIKFNESIEFFKDISYDYFIPLNLMLPNVERIDEVRFKLSNSILSFNHSEIALEKNKYYSAKGPVDKLSLTYKDYKVKKGHCISLDYSIEFE